MARVGFRAVAGPFTILVAEDEELVRAFVRAALEREGHTVLEAAGGWEALQIAEAHEGRIDLLLTDVTMPRMDGFELARQLTARRPDVRVLTMSGYVAGAGPVAAGGGDPALLLKPFTLEALYRAVSDALVESQAA